MLTVISKETIQSRLEQNTRLYFNEFWLCTGCNRIYWKGAHYDRMLALVENVKQIGY